MLCTAGSKPRDGCTLNHYQAGRRSLVLPPRAKQAGQRALPALQGLDLPRLMPEEAASRADPAPGSLLPACELRRCLCLSGDLGREATLQSPGGDECKCDPGLLGEH